MSFCRQLSPEHSHCRQKPVIPSPGAYCPFELETRCTYLAQKHPKCMCSSMCCYSRPFMSSSSTACPHVQFLWPAAHILHRACGLVFFQRFREKTDSEILSSAPALAMGRACGAKKLKPWALVSDSEKVKKIANSQYVGARTSGVRAGPIALNPTSKPETLIVKPKPSHGTFWRCTSNYFIPTSE